MASRALRDLLLEILVKGLFAVDKSAMIVLPAVSGSKRRAV
jgi:hypothetical protein